MIKVKDSKVKIKGTKQQVINELASIYMSLPDELKQVWATLPGPLDFVTGLKKLDTAMQEEEKLDQKPKVCYLKAIFKLFKK